MASSSAQPGKTSSEDAISIIRNAVEQYQGTTQAPGVCVSVIDLNVAGLETGHIYSSGVQNLIDGVPVTAETVFQIGSVTKLFTSLLTACAAVQGRIQLSDKAIGFLKRYPNVSGDSDFNNIELVNLATHTSGIPDMPPHLHGASQQLFESEAPGQAISTYWSQYTGPAKLPNCWLYSDAGFVTLGFAVAGMFNTAAAPANNYGELLRQLVTGPLGMNNTSAHPAGNLASGYGFRHGANHPAPGVAYDLKSTGNDMLVFLKANLKLQEVKVPAELAKAIDLTQTLQGTYPVCGAGNSMNMGLGWQMPKVPDGSTSVQMFYKNGATGLGGQSCVIEFVPEDGFGIAVLTNQCPNDSVKGGPSPLAREIRTRLTGRPSADIEMEQSFGSTGE